MKEQEFGERYAALQLARRDGLLRSRVKQVYLNRVLRFVRGATIDLGCGAGQLLEQLPPGSMGTEVNAALIDVLRGKRLDVVRVPPDPDGISLGALRPGTATTAVLSHVLEHFDDAASVLGRLIADCAAHGITRLIVVVPGLAGFRSDATHKTFVTLDYLREHGLLRGDGFEVVHSSFFPGDLRAMGRLFAYHELMVVYDIEDRSGADDSPTGGLAHGDSRRP